MFNRPKYLYQGPIGFSRWFGKILGLFLFGLFGWFSSAQSFNKDSIELNYEQSSVQNGNTKTAPSTSSTKIFIVETTIVSNFPVNENVEIIYLKPEKKTKKRQNLATDSNSKKKTQQKVEKQSLKKSQPEEIVKSVPTKNSELVTNYKRILLNYSPNPYPSKILNQTNPTKIGFQPTELQKKIHTAYKKKCSEEYADLVNIRPPPFFT